MNSVTTQSDGLVDHMQSAAGWLHLSVNHAGVTGVNFADDALPDTILNKQAPSAEQTALLEQLKQELDAYFAGSLTAFTVPLAPQGTAFQQQVWRALQQIPYGRTCSYHDLAHQVERPRGYQAVGQANGRNPIGIIIPCHRVIQKNGNLGGYAGGIERKSWLLRHELRVENNL
ncbi:methylated-DNA--[protein]-cysteine S-methyltransferase [Aliidiomarina indica]|uniref:methylated-DNA--[protein]-cysteine S-methyltransferase n=1 Tax=Aliidiomarina indica TaxID=2749147 RepID=UPI001E2E9206|nr:methylated-DNA--[protein]-cysteine S-methyltransferase [Aliidiomarina indica]